MVSWLIFGFGGLSVESNRLHHYVILFFTDFLHWRRYFIIIHRHHCQKSRSTIHNWWCYTSQPKVRGSSRTLYALLKKILLFKTGVKYVLSTSKRRSMGCAGHSNWMMSRRTLPHPKPVPKTRTPQNGESLGRCNRPNMTSKGRLWLRCVLSGIGFILYLVFICDFLVS